MGALGLLLLLVCLCLGIGNLVCFILVLIKMFQNDQTVMGIICIVTMFCAGLGVLIAFIVGWINASNWRIQQVMLIWTGCIIGGIVLHILSFIFLPAMVPMLEQGMRPM